MGNQLLGVTLALKWAAGTKKKKVENWKDCARTLVLEVPCKVKSLLPFRRWENEPQGGWHWPKLHMQEERGWDLNQRIQRPVGVCLLGVYLQIKCSWCGAR